jgi:rhodanese-related sulfurtransferase
MKKAKVTSNAIITIVLAITMLVVGSIMAFDINVLGLFSSEHISVQTLATMLDEDYQFVDIRTDAEYSAGHIAEFDLNIDFYQFENNLSMLNGLDKEKPVVIICNSGNRTLTAHGLMKNYGFSKVYNVVGGIQAWWSM